jgi:hypothetical protein
MVGAVRRRTFDLMASLGGLALAVVLLVLGILFQQNANFAKDNVEAQLTEQYAFGTLGDKAQRVAVAHARRTPLDAEI